MQSIGENLPEVPKRLIHLFAQSGNRFHDFFGIFRLFGKRKISFVAVVILNFRYFIDSACQNEGEDLLMLVE